MVITVPLSDFYKMGNKDSINEFEESLLRFKCQYGCAELDSFLHNRALEFDKRKLCKTYLVVEQEPFCIIGYYSVGIKAVELGDISKSQRAKMTSGDRGATHIAAFILAHIAKDLDCGKQLPKGEILKRALGTIKEAQNIVGGRLIYLDCRKELVQYYLDGGFEVFHETDKKVQMVMAI